VTLFPNSLSQKVTKSGSACCVYCV